MLNLDECALVTDCKALFDSVQRETIQQATDKRVAIECLVIKDLLHDLRCQWRWVSSERQLADGLTKVAARQAFVERYRGGHIQLVADESYQAAKKKSREDRERTILETRGMYSKAAQTLIALVMATEVPKSNAEKIGAAPSIEYDYFDWWLLLALCLVIVTFLAVLWQCCASMTRRSDEVSSFKALNEALQDRVFELESENLDFQLKLKKLQRELKNEQYATENLQEHLREAQETIDRGHVRVVTVHRTLYNHAVFATAYGECWHLDRECYGLRNSQSSMQRRPCTLCASHETTNTLPPVSNDR